MQHVELAGGGAALAELVQDLQRLPVEDVDLVVAEIADVEELLRAIG